MADTTSHPDPSPACVALPNLRRDQRHTGRVSLFHSWRYTVPSLVLHVTCDLVIYAYRMNPSVAVSQAKGNGARPMTAIIILLSIVIGLKAGLAIGDALRAMGTI